MRLRSHLVVGFLRLGPSLITQAKKSQATIMQSDTNIDALKGWSKRHPILTGAIGLVVIIFIVSTVRGSAGESPAAVPPSADPLGAIIDPLASTNISYVGTVDEKDDSDRPKGSRLLTIKYSVSEFSTKDSLLSDAGTLSGKAYQRAFSDPKVSDVIVQYSGSAKDKYGNAKDSVILSESMDRETYAKINWQNFDSTAMCPFIRSETPNDNRVICAQPVDIN